MTISWINKLSTKERDKKLAEIKRLRKEENLTVKVLAERFQVSINFINRTIYPIKRRNKNGKALGFKAI